MGLSKITLKSNIKNLYFKRITIKKLVLLVIQIFCICIEAAQVPVDKNSGTDSELTTRIFYIKSDWTTLAEITAVNQFQDQRYRSVLLGEYFRFHENIRAGLFYKRQTGFRHDADWVNESVGQWRWNDTNDRSEDLAIIDVSPRVLLSFLPGDGWSFDLKTRFEHNFFNQNENLRLVPTLTYYWIHEDSPFLNFYIQNEKVFPLNYDSVKPNEEWIYLGMLYSYNSNWQIGVTASEKTLSWKNTEEFFQKTGATYTSKNSGKSVGLLVVYKFDK